MNPTRKVWHDKNNVPPTNYIWYKNGKYLENIDGKWVESGGMNNSDSGIKPDMTEAEQMQARKDLGLYYEETGTEEKTVGYPDAGSASTISGYMKLSDDSPTQDDVIKVMTFYGEENPIFTEQQDGYLISVILDEEETQVFRIVSDDSQGNEIGIYAKTDGYFTYQPKLVYNGETTVVSKVPDKYLPIAWNQLVTEGTKIAEVTIGEETTEVFAPEGGGGGGTLIDITNDLSDGISVNLTTAYGITEEQFSDILSGKVLGLKSTSGTVYIFIGSNPGFPGILSPSAIFATVDIAATAKFYKILGSVGSCTISSTNFESSSPVITLHGLPTAGTTASSALTLMGFSFGTSFDISGITGISYKDPSGNKYTSPVKIENPSNGDTKYWFDMAGNHYEIVFNAIELEATVTVTPLT